MPNGCIAAVDVGDSETLEPLESQEGIGHSMMEGRGEARLEPLACLWLPPVGYRRRGRRRLMVIG
jgi:hypothetical protein